ncbi:MAG: type II toxin-antitoxin system VapC family toxin [Bryobacteraceae bacterium]
MKAVLDTSAAIEVALARRLSVPLAAVLRDADVVLAPDLFVAEVVNTIWKYHHFEGLSLDVCDRALEAALGLVDVMVPCRDLANEAFLLARIARRPAYDMFYLALARSRDAVLLTTDAALKKEAARQGLRVG